MTKSRVERDIDIRSDRRFPIDVLVCRPFKNTVVFCAGVHSIEVGVTNEPVVAPERRRIYPARDSFAGANAGGGVEKKGIPFVLFYFEVDGFGVMGVAAFKNERQCE